MTECQCGYPQTPCDRNKHDFGHDCVAANERGGLKPQNIIQAADADLARKRRNTERAARLDHSYEQYAFHRAHVRRAISARELVLLALMDGHVADHTAKDNTRLIYGNALLLVEAMRMPAA